MYSAYYGYSRDTLLLVNESSVCTFFPVFVFYILFHEGWEIDFLF